MTTLDENDLRLAMEAVDLKVHLLALNIDRDYDAYLKSRDFKKLRDKLEIMMMEL